MQGIYKISCSQDARIYVGSSIDIERRWKDHRRQLDSGIHRNSKLQIDWDAYGDESFTFSILEETDQLTIQEQKWLDQYIDNRYNISPNAWNPMADPATAKKQQVSLNKSGNRGNQKLSETDVLEIVRLANIGVTINDLANTYKVTCMHISNIITGNRWSYLTGITRVTPIKKRNKTIGSIGKPEIQVIKDEIAKGNSYAAIGRLIGVHSATVTSWARKLNLRLPK
jgi:group I intron endonuclease